MREESIASKRVRLANQIALISGFASVAYVGLFWLIGAGTLVVPTAVIGAAFFSVLWLNRRGHHDVGRWSIVAVTSASVWAVGDALGPGVDLHLLLYSAALQPVLLFEPRQRVGVLMGLVCPLAAWVCLRAEPRVMPQVELPSAAVPILNDALAATALAVVVVWVVLLHRENGRHARLAQEAARVRASTQSRLEQLGELAGAVAHDFNNALAVIMSFATFVREQLRAGDAKRDDVDQVLAAADHARSLTRTLLLYSRPEVPRPRAVDPNRVIRDVSKLLRRLLGEDVELVLELDGGPLGGEPARVRIDPGQLEQVVVNLAVNARDAMPGGGTLKITSFVLTDCVELSVSDTGSGIDPAVAAQVFEPYFTTKEAGRGTGLGLATSRSIIESAGGRIEVSSAVDQGSDFRIRLPRVDAHASIDDTQPAQDTLRQGRETVLVVEDDPAVREMMRRTLQDRGYRVHTARDGRDALRQLDDVPELHLLLTDMVMPKMGGSELAEAVRKKRAGAKVLYISGYDDTWRQRMSAHVEEAVLDKPFTPGELAEAVRIALDGAELS